MPDGTSNEPIFDFSNLLGQNKSNNIIMKLWFYFVSMVRKIIEKIRNK